MAEKGQCEKAVCHRGAVGVVTLRSCRVTVDPLLVVNQGGEGVYLWLCDSEPVTHADFVAHFGAKVFDIFEGTHGSHVPGYWRPLVCAGAKRQVGQAARA